MSDSHRALRLEPDGTHFVFQLREYPHLAQIVGGSLTAVALNTVSAPRDQSVVALAVCNIGYTPALPKVNRLATALLGAFIYGVGVSPITSHAGAIVGTAVVLAFDSEQNTIDLPYWPIYLVDQLDTAFKGAYADYP